MAALAARRRRLPFCVRLTKVRVSVPSLPKQPSSTLSGAKNAQCDDAAATEAMAVEKRNILSLVLHQILFRTAWIFKTESVIIPAFLDSITEAGWVRGMLPPLNRFGQSVAPLLLSDRLSRSSLKSRWLAKSTFFMSLPFLSMGGMLCIFGSETPSWMVLFFLVSYGTFFCIHGVNQASFNTIQGKLIRPNRRGRLITIVGYVGSPIAVGAAWLLLRPWTQSVPPKFAYIFLFTGTMFLLASFTVGRLIELPDPVGTKQSINASKRFAEAWKFVKADHHLRRLCLLSAMLVCSQMLFPHYQRIGRNMHGYSGQMLMVWVVAQNLSAALFSWMSGRIADQRGTRSALRWLTFFAMFTPLLALLMQRHATADWYWLTFAWLGVVPVTYRMQLNYALELTERARHPIYVSTVVLCMAAPIVLSPLVGELVARTGYVVPFCGIALVVAGSWLLSLSMAEPRHDSFVPAVIE
jgi:predicted MFS family arabinose efflux permease